MTAVSPPTGLRPAGSAGTRSRARLAARRRRPAGTARTRPRSASAPRTAAPGAGPGRPAHHRHLLPRGANLGITTFTGRAVSPAASASSVNRYEPAGALDHPGGDRPPGGERFVVAHVLVVVREVGDRFIDVGEVGAAVPGAGPGGDGGQGGGAGPGAAVQHAQFLPAGPLAGGPRVAGVQRGGGLARVAADVDEIDEHRHFQAAFARVGGDGGELLLVPVHQEHPLPDPLRVPAVSLAERDPGHVLDALGDRRRDPLVACGGAWAFLAAGRRGGDVFWFADGGGEAGDRDDLGHLLDPRMRGI